MHSVPSRLVWMAAHDRVRMWQLVHQYNCDAADPLGRRHDITEWVIAQIGMNKWALTGGCGTRTFSSREEAEKFAEASYALGNV